MPGARRLARLPAEPSAEARLRLGVMQWCLGHGGKVRLTARHFGYSPDTISRWLKGYRSEEVKGLEPGSRRPHRLRQPRTPVEVVERIQALREQYPRWGREKLRVLLEEEGIQISAKSIDRVILRLRKRGVLKEAMQPRKAAKPHWARLRRPPELVVDRPGALVQMDTKQVRLDSGKTIFQFAALDCFTRKRMVALSPRLSSQEGASFLRRVVEGFPFAIAAIQSDGGSEFLGDFRQAASELELTHYFNRPNYPQGNGRVERSFRTDEEEFYQVEGLPDDLDGQLSALLSWNQTYERIRPHQALGYKTPERFYQDWLREHPQRKEVLSDMS
ncbi:MAG: helix-turn-helix domain-containing protein [Dehalococcoidia bacterium]|nr:helix-turn-helix domain-containing protein [Dehalococcoidia bacterium]